MDEAAAHRAARKGEPSKDNRFGKLKGRGRKTTLHPRTRPFGPAPLVPHTAGAAAAGGCLYPAWRPSGQLLASEAAATANRLTQNNHSAEFKQ